MLEKRQFLHIIEHYKEHCYESDMLFLNGGFLEIKTNKL